MWISLKAKAKAQWLLLTVTGSQNLCEQLRSCDRFVCSVQKQPIKDSSFIYSFVSVFTGGEILFQLVPTEILYQQSLVKRNSLGYRVLFWFFLLGTIFFLHREQNKNSFLPKWCTYSVYQMTRKQKKFPIYQVLHLSWTVLTFWISTKNSPTSAGHRSYFWSSLHTPTTSSRIFYSRGNKSNNNISLL